MPEVAMTAPRGVIVTEDNLAESPLVLLHPTSNGKIKQPINRRDIPGRFLSYVARELR
jgi:hypothetical protein